MLHIKIDDRALKYRNSRQTKKKKISSHIQKCSLNSRFSLWVCSITFPNEFHRTAVNIVPGFKWRGKKSRGKKHNEYSIPVQIIAEHQALHLQGNLCIFLTQTLSDGLAWEH